ncbi:hypothetical protein FRB94_010072 [Tulasnella sp. JGI-2019a]|nr:hypothetical protein FRB94_010072 [Tulasnella sp. JGI-2019a]
MLASKRLSTTTSRRLSDLEAAVDPRSLPFQQQGKPFLQTAPSSSEGKATQNITLLQIETNGGVTISTDIHAALPSDLDKNFQFVIAQTQTETYAASDWWLRDVIVPVHRPSAAALAIDRLNAASVELCRIMRSTAFFIFKVYDIANDAVLILSDATQRSDQASLATKLDKLSGQINQQIDFSGRLEEKLEQAIGTLREIQTDTHDQIQLKGKDIARQEAMDRSYRFWAKFSSSMGTVTAFSLTAERWIKALSNTGSIKIDLMLAAATGVLATASGTMGQITKGSARKKKAKEEAQGMLKSTYEHTIDTIRTAELHTGNFQFMRIQLAKADSMLYDADESLDVVCDTFKRLSLIFGELRSEGILAQQLMDHYELNVGCYTIEGLLGSSNSPSPTSV